jgi:hypothetical protein
MFWKYLLPLITTNKDMEVESSMKHSQPHTRMHDVIIPEDHRLKASPFSQCSYDYFGTAAHIPLCYNIKLRFLLRKLREINFTNTPHTNTYTLYL